MVTRVVSRFRFHGMEMVHVQVECILVVYLYGSGGDCFYHSYCGNSLFVVDICCI